MADELEPKIKDMLNVKDFGAFGDGKHEDREAIKHAVEYAISCGGGVVLFFPPGKYFREGILDNDTANK